VAVEGIIRDITTQKQFEDDRARSAALISALSQVAARLQDKLEPEGIIDTMGAELARFDITCGVLLADGSDHLVVKYISLDPARLAQTSQALGVPLPGYRFARARLPLHEQVWVQRQPAYIDSVIPLATAMFKNVTEAEVTQAFEAYGLRAEAHGVWAPLVADNQPLGLLLMWGLTLRETDLPAISVFASQVASALENARLFEAERDQRTLAQTLRRTAEVLNTTLELGQVLGQILEHAEGLIPYDLALITLREGDEDFTNWGARGYDPLGKYGKRKQTYYALADFPLLSETAASGRPRTIPDTTREPNWVVVPEAVWVRSQVMAPLRIKGKVSGFISLSSATPNFYNDTHAPRLQALADQAAVALENAMLFEKLAEGSEQLRHLSQRLLEVQESERRQIARELHDEIGQALTGLQLFLEADTRAPLGRERRTGTRARLDTAQSLVKDLINRVRDLSLDLRPTMLDDLGLVPALLWQFERYTAQTGIQIHFRHFGLERRFASDLETAAYRIVQEALTNVARYALVETASVNLWADATMLNVQVEDQGIGFDADEVRRKPPSNGLAGMRERASLLNGQLTIETAPGAGTQITAELPVRQLATLPAATPARTV
jgi:signal transduction histidine kinase